MINKFVLTGDKFMFEMHFRQPRFTCSTCEPFIENKERNSKVKKKTEDSRYIYQNELDKVCFQNDIV